MFFQPPEKEITNSDKSSLKSARRKRKKRAQKLKNKKQVLKKEKQRFANTMSSWAANFTMAATWQLKHQVAHWKSKARALEYENNILRNMLKQYYVDGKISHNNESNIKDENTDLGMEAMSVKSDIDSDSQEDVEEDEEDEENEEEKMEISEEFIDFLKGNAEFRKMRLERERLRKLEDEMPIKKLEACPDAPIDSNKEFQKLYGANWQRIAALEMNMQSQFMSDCDKDKPLLWPILPIRLTSEN